MGKRSDVSVIYDLLMRPVSTLMTHPWIPWLLLLRSLLSMSATIPCLLPQSSKPRTCNPSSTRPTRQVKTAACVPRVSGSAGRLIASGRVRAIVIRDAMDECVMASNPLIRGVVALDLVATSGASASPPVFSEWLFKMEWALLMAHRLRVYRFGDFFSNWSWLALEWDTDNSA